MKIRLLFLLLALGVLTASAQPIIEMRTQVTTVGTSANRAPNGTSIHTTMRAGFIIPATELSGLLASGTLIKRFGFVYASGTNTVAGGTIRFYLQNTSDATFTKSTTWTTLVTGMTEVYNGSFNLPVGGTAANVSVALGSNFTYTGGGLYVAYDYLGTQFATTAATYTSDQSIPGSIFNGQSATTTPPATVGATSAFRPVVSFGIDNPYQNDIAVTDLDVGFGRTNRLYTNTVTATVRNSGALDAANIQVSLNVSGANAQVSTVSIPALAGGASTQVVFTPTSANIGNQALTVSVPGDQNNGNNSLQKTQSVGCGELAFYGNADVPFDGIGFNTGSGIIGVRYRSPAVGITVSGVDVHIHTATASVGKQVGGVLLDANGAILAESALQTVTTEQLGTRLVFTFPAAVAIAANTDYHVGLKQTAATPGYFPVGTFGAQNIPASRVYSFAPAGGSATNYTNLGTLMVGAQFSPAVVLSSSASGTVQAGTTVTFTAGAGFGQYIFKVNGNTVQTGTGNTYGYAPLNNDVVSVEASLNGCAAPAASLSVAVDSPLPIQLYSFTAKKERNTVKLDWQTLGEKNNREFVLGRSADGLYFTEIARIPGAVNSQVRRPYQFVDVSPYQGNNYYRLEQFDLDGKGTEVGVRTLDFSLGNGQVSFFPNPVRDVLNISFSAGIFRELQLADVSGKLVYVSEVYAGDRSHRINLTGYPKGVYVLTAKGKGGTLQQKVVKD